MVVVVVVVVVVVPVYHRRRRRRNISFVAGRQAPSEAAERRKPRKKSMKKRRGRERKDEQVNKEPRNQRNQRNKEKGNKETRNKQATNGARIRPEQQRAETPRWAVHAWPGKDTTVVPRGGLVYTHAHRNTLRVGLATAVGCSGAAACGFLDSKKGEKGGSQMMLQQHFRPNPSALCRQHLNAGCFLHGIACAS